MRMASNVSGLTRFFSFKIQSYLGQAALKLLSPVGTMGSATVPVKHPTNRELHL